MNTNQFDLLKTRRFLPLFLTQSFGAFNDNLQSLLDARETHGSGHEALEDVERKPMSYGRLITGAFVLGRALSRGTQSGEHVGVLLPNAAANAVTFFGLLAHGRVPAMINFSTGTANAVSACGTADIKRVISSRRFIEMGKLQDTVDGMTANGVQVQYLEDVGASIGIGAKLLGLLAARMSGLWYRFSARERDPDDAAVILFTSGCAMPLPMPRSSRKRPAASGPRTLECGCSRATARPRRRPF